MTLLGVVLALGSVVLAVAAVVAWLLRDHGITLPWGGARALTWLAVVGVGMAAVLFVVTRGWDTGDTAATWVLAEPDDVASSSRHVDVLVSRIGCADGFTGEAQEPSVSYASDRIVVEIDVEPLRLTEAGCPGNEQVEVTVELSEPVGQREIVDGACLKRRDLTDCQQATRWSPAMVP